MRKHAFYCLVSDVMCDDWIDSDECDDSVCSELNLCYFRVICVFVVCFVICGSFKSFNGYESDLALCNLTFLFRQLEGSGRGFLSSRLSDSLHYM